MRFTPGYEEDWESLRKMLAEGEHEGQDFKQIIGSKEKIARTLAAFANGNGGRLLVGVDDKGNIKGCDVEEDMYLLHEAAENFCDPPVDLEFVIHEEDGVEVLEARVLRSLKKPHAARDEKGQWQIYVRVGDETLLMGLEEKVRKMDAAERTTLKVWLNHKGSINDLEAMKLLSLSKAEARRLLDSAVAEGWLIKKTRNGIHQYLLR